MLGFLKDKKFEQRSIKAQKKVADQFMGISTNVASAVLLTFLLYPATKVLDISLTTSSKSLLSYSEIIQQINILYFAISYFIPIGFSIWSRKEALDIYHHIEKIKANKIRFNK